ncbi:MAG: hypothetical protein L0Z07_07225 [Planctomycetes bacterium]|nr:hypothetical protein [Planctomycetota bacterium]
MPFGLRLFVKKRGTRRTGSRWQAMLAEGVVDAALLAIGLYGLYWLVTRFITVEGAGYNWWPWLVMVIPFALIAYGAVGVMTLLWKSYASTERRAATVQKATDWEIPGTDVKSAYPPLPTIPPIDAVVDSPGVRLAFRLPIDAAPGWVSATMAAICLTWNTLVAIFVIQILRQHVAGNPNWLLTWLMVPFVLAGLWTLAALGRQVLISAAIGTTRVEVSDHPFFPGERYQGLVSQTGRLHVRWFQVQLLCEEQAIYQQGTDTRIATARVYRDVVFSQRKFDITPGQAFESGFEFTIPVSAMHSFATSHNAVHWTLVVRGRVRTWGEIERRFLIFVYPAAAAEIPVRELTHSFVRNRPR